MTASQYVRYGALSGLLLLCAVMLSSNENNENSVFAQNISAISPASDQFSIDDSSPNSSLDSVNDNDNDESTGSSGSNDDHGQGTAEEQDTNEQGATSSTEQDGATEVQEQNDNDGQGTSSSTEQDGATEEQTPNEATEGEQTNTDYQLANSLLDLRNKIDEVLTFLK
jgi:hypothetical protein